MTSSKTAANSTPILPYTGAEYLASLNDDRCVYLHGERVKDIVNHPAFRNSARMIARWYDVLHEKREQICVPTDTGSGGFTHPVLPRQSSRSTPPMTAVSAAADQQHSLLE
jgi:4-hydroxyphenylacetate 3-monooxygenase